jgi:hypothetical protein
MIYQYFSCCEVSQDRMIWLQERDKAENNAIKCGVAAGKKVVIVPKTGGGKVDDENGEVAIRFVR